MRTEHHETDPSAIEQAVVEMMGDQIFEPGFLPAGAFTEVNEL